MGFLGRLMAGSAMAGLGAAGAGIGKAHADGAVGLAKGAASMAGDSLTKAGQATGNSNLRGMGAKLSEIASRASSIGSAPKSIKSISTREKPSTPPDFASVTVGGSNFNLTPGDGGSGRSSLDDPTGVTFRGAGYYGHLSKSGKVKYAYGSGNLDGKYLKQIAAEARKHGFDI